MQKKGWYGVGREGGGIPVFQDDQCLKETERGAGVPGLLMSIR